MRKQIKKALDKLGKSRYWLAKESGVATSNLYTWLDGKNTLGEDGVAKVAAAINKNGGRCGRWYAYIRGQGEGDAKLYYFNSYDDIVEVVRGMVVTAEDQESYYETFDIIDGSADIGGTVRGKGIIEAFERRVTFSIEFLIQERF